MDTRGRAVDDPLHLPLLDAWLRRLGGLAADRPGVALWLWGEPGIGKTHAVTTLLRALPCRHLRAPAARPLPLLLADLPPTAAGGAPRWSTALLERVACGESAPAATLAEALAASLAALGPFVLQLEDMHEAGAAQRGLWLALAEAIGRVRGAGLLVTSRTPPPTPFAAFFVGERLQPLDLDTCHALLEREVGGALPRAASEWIFRRAGGNPLFTLEFFRFLARRGFLWSDGRRWRWREPIGVPGDPAADAPLPASVEALILQQLRGLLEGATGAALEARALLPHDPDPLLWARVAGLAPEALERQRLELRRHGVLQDDAFTHPLYREVVAQQLAPANRRTLARRAVAALRAREPVAAAAFAEAAELPDGDALALLQRAADAALAAGADADAARLLARASARCQGVERARLARRAAELLQPFDLAGAVELARRALDAHPDDPDAVLALAQLLSTRGEAREAERLIRRLPPTQQAEARWLRELIALRSRGHDYAGALELWRAHPELQAFSDTPEEDARLLGNVAFALLRLGEREAGAALLARARALPDLGPLVRGELRGTESLAAFYRGRYERAVEIADAALADLDEAATRAAPVGAAARSAIEVRKSLLNNRAIAFYKLGRYREAVRDTEEALQLVARTGDGRRYAELQANLACTLIDLADYERAEELLADACATLERFDAGVTLVAAHGNLAYLYLEWRPPYGGPLALKHAHRAVEGARRLDAASYLVQELFFAAWAEALHGDPRRALDVAGELQRRARALEQPHFVAMGVWTEGLALDALGDAAAALARIEEGVAGVRAQGLTSSAERMALEADRLRADAAAARERLQGFRERGAHNALNVALRYFPLLARDPVLGAGGSLGGAPADAPPNAAPHVPSAGAAPRRRSSGGATGDEPTETPAPLRLEVLGPFRLLRNGQPFAYRAAKGRLLLARLLEAQLAGHSEVAQLTLIDELYPDAPETDARASLQQLVYRLRQRLGPGALLRTGDGYALGRVTSDAAEFIASGDTRLWRGPFLQGVAEIGEGGVREALEHLLEQRFHELLELRPAEAARLAGILMQMHPYSRAALQQALRAHQRLGDPRGAARTYRTARARFAEVGEALPGDWRELLSDALTP